MITLLEYLFVNTANSGGNWSVDYIKSIFLENHVTILGVTPKFHKHLKHETAQYCTWIIIASLSTTLHGFFVCMGYSPWIQAEYIDKHAQYPATINCTEIDKWKVGHNCEPKALKGGLVFIITFPLLGTFSHYERETDLLQWHTSPAFFHWLVRYLKDEILS